MGGQENGKYAVQYAEKVLPELEALMEYKLGGRVSIMVYNDLSDLNQTNIGIGTDLYNIGGQVQIIENKMFIYFNGNHIDFERQIKQGIAQTMMSHMMQGVSAQEILQNAVLLNLPAWFVSGFTSYAGKNWDSEMDDRLKDNILNGRFKKVTRLRGEEATFYGHAFWHYVEEKFGKTTLTNLLYITRTNRSLENGCMFVLGGSLKSTLDDFYRFYYARFSEEKENKTIPDIANIVPAKIKNHRKYTQLKLSEDAKKIAYASNEMGKWRVHFFDTESKKRKRIVRGGLKTNSLKTDFQYPLLAFSPDNKMLAIIYERRDKMKMLLYDYEKKKKEKTNITKFQSIHDFCFTDNPKQMLFSAVNRGRSDIYTYQIPSTTTQQLTTDHYDDLNVGFYKNDSVRGVIFSSNRLNDTLQSTTLDTNTLSANFDLYFYNLNNPNGILTRLTNTPFVAETNPQQYNQKYFSYTSDDNGIKNRYLGYMKNVFLKNDTVFFFKDSTVTNPQWQADTLADKFDSMRINKIYKDIGEVFPQTNYVSNIVEEDISYKAGKTAELFLIDGKQKFLISPIDTSINEYASALNKTSYAAINRKQEEGFAKKKNEALRKILAKKKNIEEEPVDTAYIDETVLFFQSEFNTVPENNVRFSRNIEGSIVLQEQIDEENNEPLFKFNKVLPYQLSFSTDYVNAQLDNSLLITRYERFAPGTPASFNNPALSPMITLGTGDLFEDYKITAGFRVPVNLQDTEYFISFENLRKRLDKKLTYYRRSVRQEYTDSIPFFGPISNSPFPIQAKQKTNYVELKLNYAIDVIRSIRSSFAYRSDRQVYLLTDERTLNLPVYNENWVFFRTEYVFDNTIKTGLNLLNGLRFKVWGEIHKDFTMTPRNVFGDFDIKLPSFGNGYLGVVGFDIRHYLKIHKEIIWANRFSYGASFGTRKLIYYLGGVDSWILPRFDQSIPVSNDNNYAFQTVVTNMRGFNQNIRNGNNFAVINSEIRIPLFSYLINTPIRSEFIKNFQIIGFTDIGTAWEGFNPYDPQNPLFTETFYDSPIPNNSVTVKVNYYRNPIVSSYGFGLRSVVLGYFIRFDLGWGNDSGRVGRPVPYFSLSTDF